VRLGPVQAGAAAAVGATVPPSSIVGRVGAVVAGRWQNPFGCRRGALREKWGLPNVRLNRESLLVYTCSNLSLLSGNMAALGTVPILDNPALDCGLARALARRPTASATLTYKASRLQVSPESPFAICSFSATSSHTEAVQVGSVLLEEALDLLCMNNAEDIVTRDGADEYFVWWTEFGKKVIAFVDTGTSTFLASATLTTTGSAKAPAPPADHHPAFRFFRLSQVSEDLFDAFRSMYLAFELLLSSRYPKTKGLEIEWLRSSLTAAAGDVLLTDLVPAGNPAPIDFVIATIYDNARLPLFHAKDGKTYFVPSHNEHDRAPVKAALTMLTLIVLRMANSWHGIQRPRTSLSSGLRDALITRTFARAFFVASADAQFSDEDPLSSPSITSGMRFPAHVSDMFEGQKRFNLSGSIDTAALGKLEYIEMLHVVDEDRPLTSSKFKVKLNFTGFDCFKTTQFFRIMGAGAPRTFYSR
jgi:hypothetical protein